MSPGWAVTVLGLKASSPPAPTVIGILVARARGRSEMRARGMVGYMMLMLLCLLACCLWGNNECFADWLGAKSERLKEFRIENMTKGKCSLSKKECLSYKEGQKRQSCLLYRITQMLIWKLSYGPWLTVPG